MSTSACKPVARTLLVAAALICGTPTCAQEVGQERNPEAAADQGQSSRPGGTTVPLPQEAAAPGEVRAAEEAENEVFADREGIARRETMPPVAELLRALPRFGEKVFARAADQSGGMPVANTPVPPDYVIGPGDSLSLRVWARQREQTAQTCRVTSEGFVVLPQLGTLAVAGQRLEQLRQAVTEAYRQFYTDPTVTLVVAEQRIVEVYVTGEALRPGKHTLVGMATVFTALYAAGGPSAIGSYRDIRLVRQGQDTVHIDLYDYLLHGRQEPCLLLQPGDTLFIPPLMGQVGVSGQVRRPARYELSGETTVADAMQMAGGMAPTAYASAVQLWRTAEHREWRLTALNCSGAGGADLQTPLQDGDLLRVRSILDEAANTVQIVGAVRRPGTYPVAEAASVAALVEAAEGLAVDAHMDTGVLRRLNEDLDYEMIPFSVRDVVAGVPGADPAPAGLRPHDVVEILSQHVVEPPPEVEVSGAVMRPGKYEWTVGMQASHLVLLAGGPLPGAYLERASLLRLTPDQRRQHLKLNLQAALNGEPGADPELARGDILRVLLRADAIPASLVHVDGYVQRPGSYPRDEDMRVSDLILAAGGLTPGAGATLELAPGRFEGETPTVALQLLGGPPDWRVEPDLLLSDDDSVSVAGRGDFKQRAEVVYLRGRVRRTGSHILNREGSQGTYTVWDLLQDGGGLLPDAYPAGIVLYRPRPELLDTAQTDDLSRVIAAMNRETQLPRGTVTLGDFPRSTEDQTAAMSARVADGLSSVLSSEAGVTIVLPPRPVNEDARLAAIPVEGGKLMESEGQLSNIELLPGDTVVVPPRPSTVTVLGAVARSGAGQHVPSQLCHLYLEQSGGPRADADVGRMVVVHCNGAVEPIRLNAQVEAGDVIVVPSRHIVRTVKTESSSMRWLRSIVSIATAAILF